MNQSLRNTTNGNTSEYVYVRADTGCNVWASLSVPPFANVDGYIYLQNWAYTSGTWLDPDNYSYFCGSVAPGYVYHDEYGDGNRPPTPLHSGTIGC